FLFLYVPPTPVSYTLSLHDALPIFDGQDARSVDVDLATRSRQGFAHLPENVDAAGPGLRQRLAHDGGGDAGDLDVHLQRGDALVGTGDLAVHVAERVFRAEGVAEDA